MTGDVVVAFRKTSGLYACMYNTKHTADREFIQ